MWRGSTVFDRWIMIMIMIMIMANLSLLLLFNFHFRAHLRALYRSLLGQITFKEWHYSLLLNILSKVPEPLGVPSSLRV